MRITVKRINALLIVILMAAAAYMGGCAAFLIHFPKEIVLTEHGTHRLPMMNAMPFNVLLREQTASVFKLSDSPLTVETAESGTAEMTLNAFGFPLKRVTLDVVPDIDVVPCGMTIGVRINTDGVLVLGLGPVRDAEGRQQNPSDGRLKPSDLILTANGTELRNKEDLLKIVAAATGPIAMRVRRDGIEMEVSVTPVRSFLDGKNAIGIYARDSTKGIGTITYYDPATRIFGALGHGIIDVDTKQLMSVKNGWIMSSKVTSVKKGMKGTPGELEGEVEKERIIGQIKANTPCGIYGLLDTSLMSPPPSGSTVKVATSGLIREGAATVMTNVSSNEVKEYEIQIESINRLAADETKGMVIRITDPELLKMTSGIVQGMSGSPILQNGRLIGAITHVFVQDPAKGYAIFIENMLKNAEEANMV